MTEFDTSHKALESIKRIYLIKQSFQTSNNNEKIRPQRKKLLQELH